MSRLQVFCFLYLTFISSTRASIEQFLYKDISPKCCNQDEMLSIISSDSQIPYDCVPDVNRTSYVLTNEISLNFPWNSSDISEAFPCIDDIFNEETGKRETVKITPENLKENLNLNFFPKCCPTDSAYDMFDHKCVKITNETNADFLSFTEEFLTEPLMEGLLFIKPGLSECSKVVVDYELDYFDMTNFTQDKGIFLDALNKTFAYGSYCVDKLYNSENYITRICHNDFNVCKKRKNHEEKIRCIRKCCPDGSFYKGGGQCKYGFNHGLSLGNDSSKVRNFDEPFAIVHGIDCRKYIVELDWDYTLDEMGNLKLNLEEDKSSNSPFEHSYCFEHVDVGLIQEGRLFLCFRFKDKNRIEFQISRIALLFSVIFLFLTLLGYILLPEMQNLHGKTLMCHCLSLLVAFLFLVILQFHPTLEDVPCKAVAYIAMYLFLAAFMWSNIMCFDIWWTFGSMRVQGINQKKKELKRFLWYCLYAWSVPLVITGATFTVQQCKHSIPEYLQPIVPDIGYFNCFFEQRTNVIAFLTWFTLPIALVIVCNLVLYIKTILYCYKVKSEIDKMKDTPQSSKNERKKALSTDTERMKMAVKLFLIMGIPWMFESISICTIPVPASGAAQIVQIIFDTLNCLQGVFIFCIFILKLKFFHAIQKKLGVKYLRRSSQSTTSGITTTTYIAKV